MSAKPFADAAPLYQRKGWSAVPLPPRQKKPPPTGWTGYLAPYTSGADVADWASNGKADHNIGIRLPENVIGLDLDAYGGKPGAETMADAVREFGELPPTYCSTSRDDGQSGIRFYRVPPGRRWADTLGPGVEIIHWGHRYAVAAPSVHPEGRVYGWHGQAGDLLTDPPSPGDLPELPRAWVLELDRGDVSERSPKADVDDGDVATFLAAFPAGAPCPYVTKLVKRAEGDLDVAASRHDTVRDFVIRMLRAGEQGHHGAGAGLDTLHAVWLDALHRGERRKPDHGEWERMVTGAVAIIVKDPTSMLNIGCCGKQAAPAATVNTETGSAPDPETKASTATQLVELALTRWHFGMSTEGDAFALPLHGAQIVRPLTGSRSLRAELADLYQDGTGKVAAQQALADAVLALEGRARRSEPVPLFLRVASDKDAIWLDLGTLTGEAIRVTASGWQLVSEPAILFRRTALTGALPVPVAGGDLAQLWSLLNVAEDSRPVLLGWLVAALLIDVPHPVAVLVGEQGTGKSTASRVLTGLLDPSPAQLRKPPRDVESWTTAAFGSWVVGVDNVSAISTWWSDSLCRAVTGDGDVRRKLYSDSDLTVFAFRRCVLLNGIDVGAVRDDLAERLLTVELARITDRKYDADLARAWDDAHPRILGALLDLTARVLTELPDVRLTHPPRMADFARILAAVDRVLGTGGLATYARLAAELATDAVTGDPVLVALSKAVTGAVPEVTGAELLSMVKKYRTPEDERSRDWPKDSRAMTSLLRRRAPSLRRTGWVVNDLGRGGHQNLVRFKLVPPSDAVAAGDAGDVRATGGRGGRQAGDSDHDARMVTPALTCEDYEWDGDAGDAGDKYEDLPLDHLEVGETEGYETHPLESAVIAARNARPPASTFDLVGIRGPRCLHCNTYPALADPDDGDDGHTPGCTNPDRFNTEQETR